MLFNGKLIDLNFSCKFWNKVKEAIWHGWQVCERRDWLLRNSKKGKKTWLGKSKALDSFRQRLIQFYLSRERMKNVRKSLKSFDDRDHEKYADGMIEVNCGQTLKRWMVGLEWSQCVANVVIQTSHFYALRVIEYRKIRLLEHQTFSGFRKKNRSTRNWRTSQHNRPP